MKKILIDCLVSFAAGAGLGFVVILIQSIKYMVKFKTGAFALAVGWGNVADRYHTISGEDALFICLIAGAVLLLADLIFMIVKALQGNNV